MNEDYNLDYDELKRIYRLEVKSPKLSKLHPDFYKLLKKFFIDQKKKYINSIESSLSHENLKKLETLKKMIQKIRDIRLKKCMNLCLIYSRTDQFKDEGLVDFEVDFAKSMLKLIDKQSEYTHELFGNVKNKKKEIIQNLLKVRFVQQVPMFIGGDMKEYGPFEKDQVCELPEDICSILSSKHIIEKVD